MGGSGRRAGTGLSGHTGHLIPRRLLHSFSYPALLAVALIPYGQRGVVVGGQELALTCHRTAGRAEAVGGADIGRESGQLCLPHGDLSD